MKVVIIGASFAGIAAALEIRKKHTQAKIIMLEKQSTLGYIPNGLHLYWDNKIKELGAARFIATEQLDREKIDYHLGATVIKVNTKQKIIHYMLGENEHMMSYDKLIIATGSRQFSEKIKGSQHESVLKYKRYHEAEAALKKVESSQHITIIGGGQVGIEAADLLSQQRKKVTLIESMDYVLFKYLDQEMISPIEKAMLKAGIDLKLRQTVSSVDTGTEGSVTVNLLEDSIKTDAVILSVNVRPELAFLDEQIKLHADQTIEVDQYMKTSAEDVFAVGDCIQLMFEPGEERAYVPLINNAVRTGIVAAANLNEAKTVFEGSLRTIGTRIFGYYVASTGMTESESLFSNREVETRIEEVKLTSLPDAKTLRIKWVYEANSGILLGAQLISKVDILEKINTLALAIQTKQTIDQLKQKDFFFQAAYSQIVSATNPVSWMRERVEEDEN